MFAIPCSIRKRFSQLLAGVAMIWLAACEPVAMTGITGGTQPASRGAVQVALLVPHGTAGGQEQQLARDLENAARMAVSDLSGVEIDLRVYSTEGRPDQAQAVANAAANDGARIIIGPLTAESANAVGVAMAPRGINVLTFSNNATIAGGNVFVLGQTFGNIATRLARYSADQGKSRIVAVHSNNLSGRLGRAAIEQALRNNGALLVGSVGYDLSQQGVLAALSDISDTIDSQAADAIFLTSTASGALPLLSQLLPENGVGPDVVQYIGLARWDTPRQTLELSGLQGGWFALPDPNRAEQFNGRFRSAYGNTPHPLAGLAYDGVAAVGALVQSGQGLDRGSLTQSAGFRGVHGAFRLRPDGTNERSLAVATITDNQVRILSPAPQTFDGVGF